MEILNFQHILFNACYNLVNKILTGDNYMRTQEPVIRDSQTYRINFTSLAATVWDLDRYSIFIDKNDSSTLNTILRSGIKAFIETPLITAIDSFKKEFQESIQNFQKDNFFQLRIRLQNDVWDALNRIQMECDNSPHCSVGNLARYIVEKYTRLTPREREQLVYADQYRTIVEAINKKFMLVIHHEKAGTFEFTPYKVMSGSMADYNYILGIGDNKPISLRLCRITRVYLKQPASLTDNQIEEIRKQIRKNGVQYIGYETYNVQLSLTAKGYKIYKSVQHLRPKYISNPSRNDDGSFNLNFNCSLRQIKDYFLKFGKDAYIIKPLELRIEFFEFYQEAINAYSSRNHPNGSSLT